MRVRRAAAGGARAGRRQDARARGRRATAGVPVLEGSGPVADGAAARAAAAALGYPLFVKAAMGGGGRGMRLVRDAGGARGRARRRAARGGRRRSATARSISSRRWCGARHIEVQLLADAHGRDRPSVRARLLGAAPPPEGDRDHAGAEPRPGAARADLRRRRSTSAREIGYVNAGTVEFLVDRDGRFAFIEMNPRIQVEHTVTEETTEVDLVRAQILIAGGATLARAGARRRIGSASAASRCSAGSRPRTRRRASGPTPGGSPPTARRAAPGSASTRARRSSAPRSRRSSTRCW